MEGNLVSGLRYCQCVLETVVVGEVRLRQYRVSPSFGGIVAVIAPELYSACVRSQGRLYAK